MTQSAQSARERRTRPQTRRPRAGRGPTASKGRAPPPTTDAATRPWLRSAPERTRRNASDHRTRRTHRTKCTENAPPHARNERPADIPDRKTSASHHPPPLPAPLAPSASRRPTADSGPTPRPPRPLSPLRPDPPYPLRDPRLPARERGTPACPQVWRARRRKPTSRKKSLTLARRSLRATRRGGAPPRRPRAPPAISDLRRVHPAYQTRGAAPLFGRRTAQSLLERSSDAPSSGLASCALVTSRRESDGAPRRAGARSRAGVPARRSRAGTPTGTALERGARAPKPVDTEQKRPNGARQDARRGTAASRSLQTARRGA